MRKTKQTKDNTLHIKPSEKVSSFFNNHQVKTVIGVFTLLFGVFLGISFISFFLSWQEDQSILLEFQDKEVVAQNLLGKIGASLGFFFIYKGFGIAAFAIPFLLFLAGSYQLLLVPLKRIFKSLNWSLLGMIWISTSFGFLNENLRSSLESSEGN